MVIAVNGVNKTNIFERLFYGLKYKIQMVLAAFAAKADCTDKNTTVVSARAEYIINTYGNSIMRLAYSYLHNMSDAEDILQETLIKYVKTAPKFENDSHEKAWLMTVAANLSKNKIDYNRIRTTDELQDTLVAEERENLSFVWEAVKQLPSKYTYATIVEKEIDGINMTIKGNENENNVDKFFNVTWTKDGYSYSLSFENGVDLTEVENIINSTAW